MLSHLPQELASEIPEGQDLRESPITSLAFAARRMVQGNVGYRKVRLLGVLLLAVALVSYGSARASDFFCRPVHGCSQNRAEEFDFVRGIGQFSGRSRGRGQ